MKFFVFRFLRNRPRRTELELAVVKNASLSVYHHIASQPSAMGRQTHGDGIALGNSAEKMRFPSGLLNAFSCRVYRNVQRTFPLIFFLFVALNVVVVTTGYISRVSSAECPSAAVPLKATMKTKLCLLYTSPSPRDATLSRMPSSA